MTEPKETITIIPKHITKPSSRVLYEFTTPGGQGFCTVGATPQSCRAKRIRWERIQGVRSAQRP